MDSKNEQAGAPIEVQTVDREQIGLSRGINARVVPLIPWDDAPDWARAYWIGPQKSYFVDVTGSGSVPNRMEEAPRLGILDAEAQRLPTAFGYIVRPNGKAATQRASLTGMVDANTMGAAEAKRPGENPHSGDISGYRKMADGDVELINEIKAAEVLLAQTWQKVSDRADIDARWLHIARTEFEQGFMALVRSVARPTPRFGHN